jgi:hypothetical protein
MTAGPFDLCADDEKHHPASLSYALRRVNVIFLTNTPAYAILNPVLRQRPCPQHRKRHEHHCKSWPQSIKGGGFPVETEKNPMQQTLQSQHLLQNAGLKTIHNPFWRRNTHVSN